MQLLRFPSPEARPHSPRVDEKTDRTELFGVEAIELEIEEIELWAANFDAGTPLPALTH